MNGVTDADRTPLCPAVFFDRDGVINVDHGYVHAAEQFELVTGAARALRWCRNMKFLVFVVTNQAGVARGYYDEEAIATLHDHMRMMLAHEGAFVDDIRYCPHHPEGTVPAYVRNCDWRKPGPGMILDLVHQWPVDMHRSFLIGDNRSDINAAREAGIGGYLFPGGDLADFVVPIATAILGQSSGEAVLDET